MKKFLKEPLFHFLLIGGGLFLLYGVMNDTVKENPNRIVVTPGQVEMLAANFTRTMMRKPTPEELTNIVNEHVRDEVFCREAMELGLDQDDKLIRRRLRQKLEFILEDVASQLDPSDEELTTYMVEKEERFRQTPQVSFRQIYLSGDKRQDIPGDAKELLERLKAGEDPEQLGDRSMLESAFGLLSQEAIERRFGTEFARQVVKLPVGEWSGPVVSGFGGHLVLVAERVEGRMPGLDEAREAVMLEWRNEKRKAVREQVYQELVKDYEVVIEEPTGPTGAAAAATGVTETQKGGS